MSKAARKTTTTTRKHPALTQFTIEDRLYRLKTRLTLLRAISDAGSLFLADGEETDRLVSDCLADVEAIWTLPGEVLTPTKAGAMKARTTRPRAEKVRNGRPEKWNALSDEGAMIVGFRLLDLKAQKALMLLTRELLVAHSITGLVPAGLRDRLAHRRSGS